MLSYVVNRLLEKSIHNIVCERGIDLSYIGIRSGNIVYINDVRSATFYSLGLAEKTQEPVILIVREKYISNVFTGLTEAWFQQREIYVVAVSEEILNIDLSYLKPCTRAICKVQTESDYEGGLSTLPDMRVPTVYLVKDTILENETSRRVDIAPLINNLNPSDKVLAYEPVCTCSVENSIEYIGLEEKYGIISKYMGTIIGSDNNYYLVTATDSVDLDMNIFNNRYMCSKFKVILIGKEIDSSKRDWIEKNGIYFYDNHVFNNDTCRGFLELTKPAVWNLV